MTLSIGRVKWYGGFNRKKDTENKFGFVDDISGVDVYLHEKAWEGDALPRDNQIVVYILEENKGKQAARKARNFRFKTKEDISLFHENYIKEHTSDTAREIKTKMMEEFALGLSNYSAALLHKCAGVIGKEALCSLLETQACWDKNFKALTDKGVVTPFVDIPLAALPSGYIASNSDKVAEYLMSLDIGHAKREAQAISDKFSGELLCFALLARLIEPSDIGLNSVSYFVRSIYLGNTAVPDYLKQYIDQHIKPRGGVLSDAIVGPIFSHYQLKRYLHTKDIKFVSLYDQSTALQSRIDMFILKEIFSLVLAGNRIEDIYNIFLGKLWSAISNGQIDIERDRSLILALFRSCSTMGYELSCEAVYWAKQDKFLCRGQACHSPNVIPDVNRPYLEFSIYDWFSHYGICYLEDGRPSSRDFPIKLAGYFNRLYEIFDVIHCRNCTSLMLPDMRYARVEHTVIENGEYIKRDMAPAYRLTVFKCPNQDCVEYQNGHYINHCLGFDCYQLIDDRDIKAKCDSGLYICGGCGSCCSEHAKSQPVGLCPDCGSSLQLFEQAKYDKVLKRNDRFVRCSSSHCNFHIDAHDLSKRFYLPSCLPVYKAKGR